MPAWPRESLGEFLARRPIFDAAEQPIHLMQVLGTDFAAQQAVGSARHPHGAVRSGRMRTFVACTTVW